MEEYENQKRKDVDFVVGQRVFLNTKNLSGIHFKRKEEKLHERYCGPFSVVERVGPYTYRLELSAKKYVTVHYIRYSMWLC